MKNPITPVWAYYKDMNSEPDGRASIKRNLAWWAFAVACFVIQVYSVYRLPKVSVDELTKFIGLCKFYVVSDLLFILVILGITSIKELKEAAMGLRGGAANNTDSPKEEPKPEQP